MLSVINAFLSGLILALVTSWLFWRYLLSIKPKVKISNHIAKGISHHLQEEGQHVYRIKVVNFGKRQVINLTATCTVTELVHVGQGRRRITKKLDFQSNSIPALGSKNDIGNMWSITPVWVVLIRSKVALEDMLNEDCRIQFTLLATDALSATSIAQRITYKTDHIKDGDFEWGLNFDIYDQKEFAKERADAANSNL